MNHLIIKFAAYKLYSINRLGYFDTVGLVCKVFFYDVNNKHVLHKNGFWTVEIGKIIHHDSDNLSICIGVVCVFISMWSISFTIIFEGIIGLRILISHLKVTSVCCNLSQLIFFILLNKKGTEKLAKLSNFIMLLLQILKILGNLIIEFQALF